MSALENFDTLNQNAKIFNNGEPAIVEDIAITDGKIVARGGNLNSEMPNASSTEKANGLCLGCLIFTPITT
jgi:predicted amidohydrolase YtcJ